MNFRNNLTTFSWKPRKGGSKAIRKTRPVPPMEGTGAKVFASAPQRALTEAEIRALFAPTRKRMEAKGKTEEEIRARLDSFRKRQRKAEDRISPS